LTNDLRDNGQDALFRDGIHLATYRDGDELLDKADFYLRHPDLRERVAETGREAALAHHTYLHRMQSLLETVERAPTVVSRALSLPPRALGEGRGEDQRELSAHAPKRQDAASTFPPIPHSDKSSIQNCKSEIQSGLTSIILVTCGQLDYTRLCLDSI